MIYKATLDGFKAADFHRKCDNIGKTLTLIKTTKGYIFGGFTSESWAHTGDYKSD